MLQTAEFHGVCKCRVDMVHLVDRLMDYTRQPIYFTQQQSISHRTTTFINYNIAS